MLSAERQSARMSKSTNDGTGCFMAYPYFNSGRQRVNFNFVREFLSEKEKINMDTCEHG